MATQKCGRYFHVLLLIVLGEGLCEPYNLYGEPGQAYSIEVNLGHPPQTVNLVVDTGSTTLTVATQPTELNGTFFNCKSSSSLFDSRKEVTSKYSEGMWTGHLGSDYVRFPSLSDVPEIRTELALITESSNLFMNGSKWQGILGLAYLPIAARGEDILVDSWISSLDRSPGGTDSSSFQLTLCGPAGSYNATHYGRLQVFGNHNPTKEPEQPTKEPEQPTFKTPVLRKRWYEVGIIAIRVISSTNSSETKTSDNDPDKETCRILNEEKSFIDSGTTNIKLPKLLFRQVVDQLKSAAQSSNMLILDEFWYQGEAACWPEPQNWSLPWLAIDLLSTDSDQQYFTLDIPSQNYMRVMTAVNNESSSGAVSEFCYKLGIEAASETVLGYTAMEGYQVLFNRSAGWIGFKTSQCGPKALIHGPYNATSCLIDYCQLKKSVLETPVSIKTAQWTLFAISLIACGILVYVLAPCVKSIVVRRMAGPMTMSLSQAALVEQELNT